MSIEEMLILKTQKDCFFSIWMNLRIPLVANGIYWVTP